ncbi:MAG: isoaspartyl peptidase/L-asparaginase, partial [Flavobacteriales bacterium]
MSTRRKFLELAASIGLGAGMGIFRPESIAKANKKRYKKGIVLSTWNHGIPANKAAMEIISSGGSAVDAAEVGVRIVEADPEGRSVGIGGLPDRDGYVTLDACIMNHEGNAGAVCFLEDILHPISVARKIMDETPHVMLAGSGAKKFALANGFTTTKLLTPRSKKAWEEWLKTANYKPVINIENHDTIGLI